MENGYILNLGELKSGSLEALMKSGIKGEKAEKAAEAAIAQLVTRK